ncbi:MAG: hypothetical protein HQL37_00565 [Alphaproteobacteria bacterium]|nr:hypothetical protein [Alphaproteobacteria bacterium]
MPVTHSLRTMLSDSLERIRDINQRYTTPRIRMTGAVRLALLSLRVYLLLLVGLLAFKFYTILVH